MQEPAVTPAVDAAFRRLAAVVPEADWDKLVSTTTEALMRRLGTCGVLDGASPEALREAYQQVGRLLVDHTNVTLTCLAAGLAAEEAQA